MVDSQRTITTVCVCVCTRVFVCVCVQCIQAVAVSKV